MRPAHFVAAAVLALTCCARSRPSPRSATEELPALQLPADVRPVAYALDVELDPAAERFGGRVRIDVDLAAPRSTIWLHGRDLRVSEAAALAGGGRVAGEFSQVSDAGLAKLTFARAIGPGRVTLELSWQAGWAQPWDGVFRSKAPEGFYAATQFEAISARRAFPSFDDPQFKTPFDVSLTVPSTANAISNGLALESTALRDGRRRVRFATTAPMPTYLVFWAVGPYELAYDQVLPPNEVRSTPLPTRVLVPRGRGPAASLLATAAREMTPELERWFGMPFPYPKLDHVVLPDSAGVAMENAGAIAYSSAFIEPEGGYPADLRVFSAETVAHEIAHQWFGDLVTPRWWTDVWLNESFATWMQAHAVARWRPEWRSEQRLAKTAGPAIELEGLSSGRAIRQPLTSMSDVDDQFDPTTYQKGARVLGMVEHFIGDEAFRSGIHAYLAPRAHGTGSTADLVAELSRSSGRDLSRLFASFLDQPGMPLVSARTACDGAGARVELSQTRWLPRGSAAVAAAPWAVPVCVRYSAAGAIHERCALLESSTGQLPIPEGCPDWVMPDAGGYGWYQWVLPAAELDALRQRGLGHLTTDERFSVARSAWGAQRAGALPYATAMQTLLGLSADPDPLVAAAAIPALAHAREHLASARARAGVEEAARRAYRPVLERLGWDASATDTPDDAKLRAEVIALLVHVARDPAVRREAARRGIAFAALGKASFDRSAVNAELAGIALEAAVLESPDAKLWDALHARVATLTDPEDRRRVVRALALAQLPSVEKRAAALWREPGLDEVDRWEVLGSQAA
ncbi:MAG TPA: M1 family metallopeptidase, partial [Anaeromyxobacteraceae bacterium]|nr:M1 family metallopeptidase [Anaeromyxobacteraceae bacterium]